MTEENEEGGRIQWVPDPVQVERFKGLIEEDIKDLEAAEKDFEGTADE